MGLSCCFHICQFDLEACKINETFQAKLHVNHYLLCFMFFLPPTNAHRVRNACPPEMWSWVLYTADQGNAPAKRISPAR